MVTLASCSVDRVKFSEGEVMADAGPDAPLREICSQPGDEDGNGMADCMDPVCVEGMVTCAATAACNTDCSRSVCGDSKPNRAANEDCDMGTADTRTCDGDCTAVKCNDGRFNALAEEKDPPSSPSTAVPMSDQTCRYDFSTITQLYCAGSCGAWGGGDGCQKEDADALCKLKTGNPASTATTFEVLTSKVAAGVCCPTAMVTGCKSLGRMVLRGVTLDVSVHDTDINTSHRGGPVVTNVTCTTP